MDPLAFVDRRQLRRKLGFWRLVAIGLIVLVAIGAYVAIAQSRSGVLGASQVARVTISGVILDDRELIERLDRIAKADQVKGLIVSINSPGGSTFGGETLYDAIRKVAEKKPVVSDVRTLAASAGYMVALAGDRIIAGDTSITGSIGVLFQYPQVKTLLDKLGVSLEEIKSAPLKAEPSPFHPPSDAAKAVIQSMIDDSYAWFVDLVAERREIPREEALRLGDGRIFTGRQAIGLNLIDELGGEREIRDYFKSRDVADTLPIVDWEKPQTTLPFGLGSLAAIFAKSLGFDGFPFSGNLSQDKLFLDGLVSVWQVGRD
ncbi:signal peptide peptidase SppA [Rhizobiaceae bacterium CRRU44]|uniref:Signal peptide peptidase SppA n=1 Tax=Ferranicluibacter rubi TaxID=2715133 RepID=A0AA43ZBI7_9HYPH|nr:signal peptide peptidase SppA [Ferranicluibacter rubi]NHT74534.1 signal peptide peptidase SppA [Ferranicluibacter rubi]